MPTSNEYQYELNGQSFTTTDAILSGRQIRANAGLAPVSDHILIEIGKLTSRSVGLEEPINLEEPGNSIFRSFPGDCAYSLTINERGYEWGTAEISASDIRVIASISDDHELIFDSKGDKPIEADDTVRLNPKGVERILSREPQEIYIYVNTRKIFIQPRDLTFLEIVKLAFPETAVGANISYTVGFTKGTRNAPEGTLIEGESVNIKKGMTFSVSQTDKS